MQRWWKETLEGGRQGLTVGNNLPQLLVMLARTQINKYRAYRILRFVCASMVELRVDITRLVVGPSDNPVAPHILHLPTQVMKPRCVRASQGPRAWFLAIYHLTRQWK
jgi:hypothetical protein